MPAYELKAEGLRELQSSIEQFVKDINKREATIMMAKIQRLYKRGDTVKVKASPTLSYENGRIWPSGFVGYVDSLSRIEDEQGQAPAYGLYGDSNSPAWGIVFAECDLELVQSLEDRMKNGKRKPTSE